MKWSDMGHCSGCRWHCLGHLSADSTKAGVPGYHIAQHRYGVTANKNIGNSRQQVADLCDLFCYLFITWLYGLNTYSLIGQLDLARYHDSLALFTTTYDLKLGAGQVIASTVRDGISHQLLNVYIHVPSFKLISQSMLRKARKTRKNGRTDRRTDIATA